MSQSTTEYETLDNEVKSDKNVVAKNSDSLKKDLTNNKATLVETKKVEPSSNSLLDRMILEAKQTAKPLENIQDNQVNTNISNEFNGEIDTTINDNDGEIKIDVKSKSINKVIDYEPKEQKIIENINTVDEKINDNDDESLVKADKIDKNISVPKAVENIKIEEKIVSENVVTENKDKKSTFEVKNVEKPLEVLDVKEVEKTNNTIDDTEEKKETKQSSLLDSLIKEAKKELENDTTESENIDKKEYTKVDIKENKDVESDSKLVKSPENKEKIEVKDNILEDEDSSKKLKTQRNKFKLQWILIIQR